MDDGVGASLRAVVERAGVWVWVAFAFAFGAGRGREGVDRDDDDDDGCPIDAPGAEGGRGALDELAMVPVSFAGVSASGPGLALGATGRAPAPLPAPTEDGDESGMERPRVRVADGRRAEGATTAKAEGVRPRSTAGTSFGVTSAAVSGTVGGLPRVEEDGVGGRAAEGRAGGLPLAGRTSVGAAEEDVGADDDDDGGAVGVVVTPAPADATDGGTTPFHAAAAKDRCGWTEGEDEAEAGGFPTVADAAGGFCDACDDNDDDEGAFAPAAVEMADRAPPREGVEEEGGGTDSAAIVPRFDADGGGRAPGLRPDSFSGTTLSEGDGAAVLEGVPCGFGVCCCSAALAREGVDDAEAAVVADGTGTGGVGARAICAGAEADEDEDVCGDAGC